MIREFDKNGNSIHYKNSNYGCWYKYNDYNNLVYKKEYNGYYYEIWYEYNKNNELIYTKDSDRHEHWYENGNLIHYKNSNYECWSVFEGKKLIYFRNSEGYEYNNE